MRAAEAVGAEPAAVVAAVQGEQEGAGEAERDGADGSGDPKQDRVSGLVPGDGSVS